MPACARIGAAALASVASLRLTVSTCIFTCDSYNALSSSLKKNPATKGFAGSMSNRKNILACCVALNLRQQQMHHNGQESHWQQACRQQVFQVDWDILQRFRHRL